MNERLHKVEKRGGLFYVIGLNGRPLGIGCAQRQMAEEVLDEVRRSAERSIRTCMSCQQPFESEGKHNRMCLPCKKRRSR